MELMTKMCCVCREVIESVPGPLGTITHGYCPPCYIKALREAGLDSAADVEEELAAMESEGKLENSCSL